jgi:hypothetical protein
LASNAAGGNGKFGTINLRFSKHSLNETVFTLSGRRCKFVIMIRTQIQLPDELYQRARIFAAEREVSLAEITRRGLELLLDRFPESPAPKRVWKLPLVDGGGIQVPLKVLHEIAAKEEELRCLP